MSLVCAALVLINLTSEPWSAKDQVIIKRATYVCANDERYSHDAPCLKSLTKKPERHYQAICGSQVK